MSNRSEHRRNIISMNGIRNASLPYHFFYDETNNIAKLRMKAGSLNISEPICFVLGGLVLKRPVQLPDLSFFKSLMGLQKSVLELKSAYLGTGDKLASFENARTAKFLDWLISKDCFIHIQVVDPLYWGIVDIIDSAMDGLEINDQYIILNFGLKADLHSVLQNDIPSMEVAFSKCGFPNVKKGELTTLYNDLIRIIENTEVIDPQNVAILRSILQRGRSIAGDVFLGGMDEGTLLESFDKFYAERLLVFENAKHTFDEETRINERFSNGTFDNIIHQATTYSFVDSKSEIGVQISDFIVSLWGKYFSWLNSIPMDELLGRLHGLTATQEGNLRRLKDLMDRSDVESNAFFHYVASAHLIEKHRRAMIFISQ